MIRTSLVAAALLAGSLVAAPAMAKTTQSSDSEMDQTRQLNQSQLRGGSSGSSEEAAPVSTTPADYVRDRLRHKQGNAAAAGANSRNDGIGAGHTQSK